MHKKIKIIFVSLFLVLFILLFLNEGPFQSSFAKSGFSALIPADLLLEDSWYGIYFRENFIGYANFSMRINEASQGGGYLIRSDSKLKFPLLGSITDVKFEAQAKLYNNYDLKEAYFNMFSGDYFFKGNIRQDKNKNYSINIKTPTQTVSRSVKREEGIVSSLMSPVILSYIPLDQKTTLDFYDPFLNRKTKIIMENQGKIVHEDVPGVAYRIAMNIDGVLAQAIVDEKGRMIQEDFMGFKFIKREPVDLFKRQTPVFDKDFIQYFTIPAVILPESEKLNYLKLKISGIPLELVSSDFNQEVYLEQSGAIVKISRSGLFLSEANFNSKIVENPTFQQYLTEDDAIKFNSPEVQSVIKKIVGQEKNVLKIVEKISEWIDKNINKIATFSLPNTEDTLKSRRGDCGEISALMVGFLRGLGIPCYVNIGLVYRKGGFFYHAWPSVYNGNEWFDTDPALSQIVADPTHIKIFKGFENQFEITKLIGNIKIDILDYK